MLNLAKLYIRIQFETEHSIEEYNGSLGDHIEVYRAGYFDNANDCYPFQSEAEIIEFEEPYGLSTIKLTPEEKQALYDAINSEIRRMVFDEVIVSNVTYC